MTGTKLPDAPTCCQSSSSDPGGENMLVLRANNIRLTIVPTLYGAPIGRNTN